MNILSSITDDEKKLLKRCEELYSRAENSIPAATQFLSPRERYIIENRLASFFTDDESEPLCFFYGGFPSAQRTIFCALPSYTRYSFTENLGEIFKSEFSSHIMPLKIKSGGYVKLTHRDFLGSLTAFGIDRSAIGDILINDEGAIVFVSKAVSEIIQNELVHIGRDKVKISPISLPDDFDYVPEFVVVRGTVASKRLDAVLAELVSCSRDTAKNLIREGLTEHNYFTASEADAAVSSGDIISCRKAGGCKGGKFIIDSIDELSNKGRIRLYARRYI